MTRNTSENDATALMPSRDRLLDALIARPPGDVELPAYLDAWVDSAVATVYLEAGEHS